MNNFGIKISKEGKNVESKDSLDYILNSTYPNIFTAKVGTGTYLFNDSSFGAGTVNIITVPHKLDFKPTCIGYLTDNAVNYTYIPLGMYSSHYGPFSNGNNGITEEKLDCYCDSQNFYINLVKTLYSGGPAPNDDTAWKDMAGVSFNFKYYIFVNQVN